MHRTKGKKGGHKSSDGTEMPDLEGQGGTFIGNEMKT
jgi:hypothetical protein